MKITVNKVVPVFISHVVATIQRAALFFVISVFGVAFLAVGVGVSQELVQSVGMIAGTIVLGAFWVSKYIDANLKTKGSYMELSNAQLIGESTGFSSQSFTVPISKIATMYVHQDFVDKLFGVSAIVFTQMNSSVSVFGFDHADAQKFVKKFAQLQSESGAK